MEKRSHSEGRIVEGTEGWRIMTQITLGAYLHLLWCWDDEIPCEHRTDEGRCDIPGPEPCVMGECAA